MIFEFLVEVSLTPTYAAVTGLGWLQRGGCYVCANIRGGGEFGPEWHQSAVRQNKSVGNFNAYNFCCLFFSHLTYICYILGLNRTKIS